MSWWDRMLGRKPTTILSQDDVAKVVQGEAPASHTMVILAEVYAGKSRREAWAIAEQRLGPIPRTGRFLLEAVADEVVGFDEKRVGDAFEEVRAKEGDGVALDLILRVLPPGKAPTLRLQVASAFDARGQDDAVRTVLAVFDELPLRDDKEAIRAWSLLGEVAERAGDAALATKYYERAFARDVTLVAIRDRLFRLRAGQTDNRKLDAGATMMSDGALTRGRYRVLRELGRGGAGTVFLADDVQLGRAVALKVYHKRSAQDRDRLVHEAKVPASLEHPGIVRILDVDEALFAIAMEAVQGSLKDAARALPHGQAPVLAWCISLTETVMWLHSKGIIHRDLKPSNFLMRDARAVLTDFGLAAKVGTSEARTRGEGTPGYMPPEQRRGEPANASMDVYALGVSFEEMAAWCAAPEVFVNLAHRMRSEVPAQRPPLSEVLLALTAMR